MHCVWRSSCPAAWVVWLFVSLCSACVVGRCGAFPGAFVRGCMVSMGLQFPGLVAAFSGLVGTPPAGD